MSVGVVERCFEHDSNRFSMKMLKFSPKPIVIIGPSESEKFGSIFELDRGNETPAKLIFGDGSDKARIIAEACLEVDASDQMYSVSGDGSALIWRSRCNSYAPSSPLEGRVISLIGFIDPRTKCEVFMATDNETIVAYRIIRCENSVDKVEVLTCSSENRLFALKVSNSINSGLVLFAEQENGVNLIIDYKPPNRFVITQEVTKAVTGDSRDAAVYPINVVRGCSVQLSDTISVRELSRGGGALLFSKKVQSPVSTDGVYCPPHSSKQRTAVFNIGARVTRIASTMRSDVVAIGDEMGRVHLLRYDSVC